MMYKPQMGYDAHNELYTCTLSSKHTDSLSSLLGTIQRKLYNNFVNKGICTYFQKTLCIYCTEMVLLRGA